MRASIITERALKTMLTQNTGVEIQLNAAVERNWISSLTDR